MISLSLSRETLHSNLFFRSKEIHHSKVLVKLDPILARHQKDVLVNVRLISLVRRQDLTVFDGHDTSPLCFSLGVVTFLRPEGLGEVPCTRAVADPTNHRNLIPPFEPGNHPNPSKKTIHVPTPRIPMGILEFIGCPIQTGMR